MAEHEEGVVRTLGLAEAAALLRVHPSTLRERATAGAEPVYALSQWVEALLVHYDHRATRNSYRKLSPNEGLVTLTGLDIAL